MKKVVFLSLVVLFASCAGGYHYNFSLLDAQRQGIAPESASPVASVKVPDTTTTRYKITDSLVDVVLSISTYYVEFTLKNKTAQTITILWEKAAYVNTRGERKRVIHRDVNYAQKEVQQKPTAVFKGETVSEIMLPSENVNAYLYGSGGWSMVPIFSSRDLGRTAQVVLPLEIGGVVFNYVFTCRILEV
jgi:hypothetical protein